MSYVNTELFDRIPNYLKSVMGYYPDVSLFELNQSQYSRLWQRLSSSKYIYTNGYEIRPTTWYNYAFQSFKGWLGYDNHCHPELISYTLDKLAYYGYTKHFNQPDFSLVSRDTRSSTVCDLVGNEFNNLNTAQLQSELISGFLKIQPHLGINGHYQIIRSNHRFGESWSNLNIQLFEIIPSLDPQDDSLIAELISTFDNRNISANELVFIKNSKYAQAAAKYYSDRAKNTYVPTSFIAGLLWTDPRPGYLAQALTYAPEIIKKDTPVFIKIYIEHREYQKAVQLLGFLSNPTQILNYLFAIPETVRNSLIQEGSPEAVILAKYYYDMAKSTNAPTSFITGLVWDDPRPGYLAQALAYDPKIAKKAPSLFVQHYLVHKEYQKAVQLLGLLTEPTEILARLLAIPETVRNSLIQKDSPTAIILAQYYITRKQYTAAQQLYSNIEVLSPAVAFTLAIKDKNHIKAYELFKKHESTSIFSMPERMALATIFFNAAEKEYETGRPIRANKQWKEAEYHYLRSLALKKTTHHLNPTAEYLEDVYTHKRLYSLLLINADIDIHQPEKSDIANIQKAITLLRECNPSRETEVQHHKVALAKGLMRQVDTLREKIAFSYTPGVYSTVADRKGTHELELSALIKKLQELVTLLKGTKDQSLCLILGKAYFLLADVQLFFDINAPDINKNYKMAMITVPENPFYILRVAEIFETEEKELTFTGLIKLKNMGYEALDYLHWFDERWAKRGDIIYNIKDIHQPPMEPTKTSGRSFGF